MRPWSDGAHQVDRDETPTEPTIPPTLSLVEAAAGTEWEYPLPIVELAQEQSSCWTYRAQFAPCARPLDSLEVAQRMLLKGVSDATHYLVTCEVRTGTVTSTSMVFGQSSPSSNRYFCIPDLRR